MALKANTCSSSGAFSLKEKRGRWRMYVSQQIRPIRPAERLRLVSVFVYSPDFYVIINSWKYESLFQDLSWVFQFMHSAVLTKEALTKTEACTSYRKIGSVLRSSDGWLWCQKKMLLFPPLLDYGEHNHKYREPPYRYCHPLLISYISSIEETFPYFWIFRAEGSLYFSVREREQGVFFLFAFLIKFFLKDLFFPKLFFFPSMLEHWRFGRTEQNHCLVHVKPEYLSFPVLFRSLRPLSILDFLIAQRAMCLVSPTTLK